MGSMATTHPADHPSLSPEQAVTVRKIYDFVEEFFQNPKFDASHDFRHVKRVCATAITIWEAECHAGSETSPRPLDAYTVILGALLHDVEDKKYAQAKDAIRDALLHVGGMSESEAARMQKLVEGVSYSSEIKDPVKVQNTLAEIPELAIVQDADRLDAIGAIGIARCLSFGGAKGSRSLEESVQHFHDKLFKLEGMMKTATGKKMATQRSQRLHQYVDWWNSELDCQT